MFKSHSAVRTPFSLGPALVAMTTLGAVPCALAGLAPAPATCAGPTSSANVGILDGYRDHAALLTALRSLVGPNAQIVPIGTSGEGRELLAIRLASGEAAGRPAILITAGLDGLHLAGAEVALRVANELLGADLAARRPDLLTKVTIWIVPCANPDALEATLKGPSAQRGTLRPTDDDRDGTADEDGPRDMDGDGVVVEMRVKNPPAPYIATLVSDSADNRLLKTPETGVAAKPFEPPTYAVFSEGDDGDGDGRIAEDGRGEVDLNRNFPHRYPEFASDAGPHQLSEPESKALAEFVVAHPEIVAAITFGRHDSLVRVPDGRDNDATGRTPLVHGAGDIDLYQGIGKLYRDTTGQARSGSADHEGAFWLWLANHRGLLSVASTIWGRPDLPKPEVPAAPTDAAAPAPQPAAETPPSPPPPADAPPDILRGWSELNVSLGMLHDPPEANPNAEPHDEDIHPAGFQTVPTGQATQGGPAGAQGAPQGAPGAGGPPGGGRQGSFPGGAGGGGRGRRGGGGGGNFQPRGGPAPTQASATSDAESGEWLAYSDRVRNGVGFIPWHEAVHPLFGVVEIGGFHPLFRLNPPAGELDALAAKQTAFLLELIDRLPSLVVVQPTVTTLGPGLYRIESSVTNAGRLPTMTTTGVMTRARAPVIARLSSDVERIVSGDRVRKLESIAPGARVSLEWIVRAADDETIEFTVGNGEYGITTYRIRQGAVVGGKNS
ncbi:MAG: hypothetical protein JNL80_00065 [Phycisphaerae bacterium]|jgi:hypothetical protein|nr:hypothetical protein [Phycisphaerae bacterium]